MPTEDTLKDIICEVHQTPMIKQLQHIGNGKSEWSAPFCPLCEELKVNGKYDEAVASINAEKAKAKPDTTDVEAGKVAVAVDQPVEAAGQTGGAPRPAGTQELSPSTGVAG